MQLDKRTIQDLVVVSWFAGCGIKEPNEQNDHEYVADQEKAIRLFFSESWLDIKTEAQGDLTGYLAKHHYSNYGGSWNRLVNEARAAIGVELRPSIYHALRVKGWSESMLELIELDLVRIVLEATYRKNFPKAPCFFQPIRLAYESGHLPCGWSEDIERWPKGVMLVH